MDLDAYRDEFPSYTSAEPYLGMEELEDRRAYRLASRNLLVGFWSAETKGFIGIREKFNSRYLFTEYHFDTGVPFGTVRPLAALDLWLGNDTPMKEPLCLECQFCGQEVSQIYEYDPAFKPNNGMKCVGSRHIDPDAAIACEAEGTHCAQWRSNTVLFELLDDLDQELAVRRRELWTKR